MTPAALALSNKAISSSHVFGGGAPSLSSTALLTQIQLVEWTLTGAPTHLPRYFVKRWIAGGITVSQPSFSAIGLRLASKPCSAQSWASKPSICTAVGIAGGHTRAHRRHRLH